VPTTPAVLPATRTGAGPSASGASPTPSTGYPVGPWASSVCQALVPFANDSQGGSSPTAAARTFAEARTREIKILTTFSADLDDALPAIRALGPPRVSDGAVVQADLLTGLAQLQQSVSGALAKASAATTALALQASVAGLRAASSSPQLAASQRLITAKGTALAAAVNADPTCRAINFNQP